MKAKTLAWIAGLLLAIVPMAATGQSPAPPSPGLAEFMIFTQIRHAKLWLAGNARNWELADYQIDELKEGFEDVVKLIPRYRDMPVGQMIESLMTAPVRDVEGAIKARDGAKFAAAFDALTSACNSCHEAANKAMIVIQRPATSPFPNQSFAPRKK